MVKLGTLLVLPFLACFLLLLQVRDVSGAFSSVNCKSPNYFWCGDLSSGICCASTYTCNNQTFGSPKCVAPTGKRDIQLPSLHDSLCKSKSAPLGLETTSYCCWSTASCAIGSCCYRCCLGQESPDCDCMQASIRGIAAACPSTAYVFESGNLFC